MSFLPDDYEAPAIIGNYMKLKEGENRFRILSHPIIGWEEWKKDAKKPTRYREKDKPTNAGKELKHFWAFIVWNYAEEAVQILQIHQASIRKTIQQYVEDKEWGAPYFYDIKIHRIGKDQTSKYNITTSPHKEVPAHVKRMYMEKPCYLGAMFDFDGEPFGNHDMITPGIFSKEDLERSGKIQPIK